MKSENIFFSSNQNLRIKNKKNKIKYQLRNFNSIFFALIFSIIIGLIMGVFDTYFSKGISLVSDIRINNFWITCFLPIGGIFSVYSYLKWGKGSIKGMGFIFQMAKDEKITIPKRLIPFVSVATWITHLFGGSAGSPSIPIQVGTAISKYLGQSCSTFFYNSFFSSNIKKMILPLGIAAGLSGILGTPLAAAFFSSEILFNSRKN